MHTEENVADLRNTETSFYRYLYPHLMRLKPSVINKESRPHHPHHLDNVPSENHIQALILVTHSTGLVTTSDNESSTDLGLLTTSAELFHKILNQLPLRAYQYRVLSYSALNPKGISQIQQIIKSLPHLEWIFTFGATASSWIWGDAEALAKYQGKMVEQMGFNAAGQERPVKICSFFHPDMLVLNSQLKQVTWTTLLMLQKEMKLP